MAKDKRSSRPKKEFSPQSGMGFAFQLGSELISGILVGLLLGYAVDYVFGTQPWGLVSLVLLSSAAGILNIFRMLGLWEAKKPSQKNSQQKDTDHG